MKFIFKAPPLTYVTNVFTLPFDTYVWCCSFALIAVILVVIYVILVWEWRDPIFKNKGITLYSLRPNIFDVFLLEIGAVTQQGYDSEPRSNAGRIATIFTFIALMFMYTSYSANIVALLQSTTESIRTLEDLLTSRISLGVEDIIYAHYYFEVIFVIEALIYKYPFLLLECTGTYQKSHLRAEGGPQRPEVQLYARPRGYREDAAGFLCFPHRAVNRIQDS